MKPISLQTRQPEYVCNPCHQWLSVELPEVCYFHSEVSLDQPDV